MHLELEQGQKREQEQLFLAKFSDAPSRQAQISPLTVTRKSMADTVKVHVEVVYQVAEEIQDRS